MLSVVLAVGLAWQVPRACSGARAAPACRRARSIGLQLPTERTGDTFLAVIDLGEGDGTVTHEFRPYFSSSALITMRYPVPHILEAEPIQGVIKVTQAGDGLFEGDVRPPTRSHRRPHTAALTPPSSHRRPHAAAVTHAATSVRRCCAPSRRSRCATTRARRRCAWATAASASASAPAPAPASAPASPPASPYPQPQAQPQP